MESKDERLPYGMNSITDNQSTGSTVNVCIFIEIS